MDKAEQIQLLQILSNSNGVSGFEDETLGVLRNYTESLGRLTEDSLRNLYVHRNENSGNKPVVMLDAHSDEVGFMVQAILPNGLLRFVGLGRMLECSIQAQKVRVRNSKGEYLPGIIASRPPHFASPDDKNKVPSLSDMTIDIGASSAQEAQEVFGIRIGAPIVPDVDFSEMQQKPDWFIGKAFDCRIGCAAEVLTLQALAGRDLAVDVTGVFSSQEEVGTRGVKVSVKQVKPDVAICFEGTPADDTFSESYMIQAAVGKGPMLRHFDATMIANPRFQRFALDLAKELDIPCQEAVRSGGGTDGGSIHIAEQGIPCVVIGVPVRYIHSHYGIAAYPDMEAAAKLAEAICANLTPEIIASF